MAPGGTTILVRNGSPGLEVLHGDVKFEKIVRLTDRAVRCFVISDDGDLLAYGEANMVKVIALADSSLKFEAELPGTANCIKLSPKSTILAAWYPFRTNIDTTNLFLYNLTTGQRIASIEVKKQSRWEPNWTYDETLAVRHFNMELLFHEKNNFERYQNKMVTQKVCDYSLTTSKVSGKHYIACYTTGVKGQPSFVRIYEYPKIMDGQAVANKSFYKADTVTFQWSPKGEQVLLLCATDVDKSGKSYYGEQLLYYMDIHSSTFAVGLNKTGPIHATRWTPNETREQQFVVIYGTIPAKATLFNTKGDTVFEFGDPTMVNLIAFNPFGNLLALAGFGNLRGGIHVWDMERKKQVCHFDSPETTDLCWSPDGTKIMTATTAPRLRVGNGFKIWKYTGTKTFEETFEMNVELYKINWQPRPGKFEEPKVVDMAPNEKQGVKAPRPAKYVPPSMRGKLNYIESGKKAALNATSSHAKGGQSTVSNLSEREKKVKKVEKAIEAINKLKLELDSGKQLEKNQLDKIKKEKELLDELETLKLADDD